MNKNKKIIATLLITFIVSITYAQNFKDSIYKKEYLKVYDSLKKYPKNLRKVISFEEELIELSEKYKDTVRTIFFSHSVARRYLFLSQSIESIKLFKKELFLLENVTTLSEREKSFLKRFKLAPIEVLIQLGNSYAAISETEKALEYYYKGIAIAEKNDLEFYNAVIPVLIGNLKSTAGEYTEAIANYKKGIRKLKEGKSIDELNRKFNTSLTYIAMSEAYFKLNHLDSVKYILAKGLREKLDTVSSLTKINFETQKAKLLVEERKFKEAKKQFDLVQKIVDEYDPVSGILYYYKDLSKYHEELKEYKLAIELILKRIALKDENTKEFNLTNDYKTLAKLYKKDGNLEKSNEYFEKYVLNQTALEKSKKTIVDTFHSKELLDLESEKKQQEKMTTGIVVASGTIIGVLLLYLFFLSKKRKQETHSFNELLTKIKSLEGKKEKILVDVKDEVLEEKTTSDINEETFNDILKGLKTLEAQQYFLRQDCNAYNVSKKIKTNTSYLSKVINAHYQKNFNTYINDLRISFVIIKLKDDSRFRSYSVQSISEEIGYKSPDSFTKYFKRRTGLLPSVYIKKLNNLS